LQCYKKDVIILAFLWRRTLVSDVVQGIIIGGVLAFFTANLIISFKVKAIQTTVNGWSTAMQCGVLGNGILLRAARANYAIRANRGQESPFLFQLHFSRLQISCPWDSCPKDLRRLLDAALRRSWDLRHAVEHVLAGD